MRFYLDEDLSDVIAVIGRERFGLDITSAHALGTEHASDHEQLSFAARERRCLVTRNGDDFTVLTRQFAAVEVDHPGVVIVPPSMTGREFQVIAARLAYCHELYPNDTVPYLVMYLPSLPSE